MIKHGFGIDGSISKKPGNKTERISCTISSSTSTDGMGLFSFCWWQTSLKLSISESFLIVSNSLLFI